MIGTLSLPAALLVTLVLLFAVGCAAERGPPPDGFVREERDSMDDDRMNY